MHVNNLIMFNSIFQVFQINCEWIQKIQQSPTSHLHSCDSGKDKFWPPSILLSHSKPNWSPWVALAISRKSNHGFPKHPNHNPANSFSSSFAEIIAQKITLGRWMISLNSVHRYASRFLIREWHRWGDQVYVVLLYYLVKPLDKIKKS